MNNSIQEQEINNIKGTLLYNHNNSTFQNKNVILFDIFWSIIKPNDGRKKFENKDDWKWLRTSVPHILQELSETMQIVFLIDINSNQKWIFELVKDVCTELNIPIIVLCAYNKKYHKPNTFLFKSIFSTIHKRNSFMVAISGGKRIIEGINKEFADTIGILLKTPEDIFPFDDIKEITGNYENTDKTEKEVVIMVGMPGSGKSTFCKNNLPNYHLICGDTYKTQKKMLEQAKKYIENTSVIFDGTNGTTKKRQTYIDFAQKHDCNVKCIWINRQVDTAYEQIKRRKVEGGNYIPQIVLIDYVDIFEVPTENEGFQLYEV